jgi:hypothetical protein
LKVAPEIETTVKTSFPNLPFCPISIVVVIVFLCF